MSYTSPIFGSPNLDQQSIDVDFGPAADNAGRMMGMLPTPDELCQSFRDYEAAMPIYPRSAWPEMIAAKDAAKAWPYRRLTWCLDQDGEGTCFPAGTLIRMADGTQKPIEAINVLDRVLTAEGNQKTVMKTQVRNAIALFRLKLRGHGVLTATEEHPILTKRGYVKMADLKAGDEVSIPRYAPQIATGWIQTADYIEIRNHIRFAQGTKHVGVPGKAVATMTRVAVPDIIHLTPGFGRIIGLFLSEGSTWQQKVDWTFGGHEEYTLAAELVNLLRDELGIEASLRKRGNGVVNVTVYGCQWSKLFTGLCGTGSRIKRLHPTLAGGPLPFLQEVFRGWMDGDGHTKKNGTTAKVGRTISKELAFAMYDVANAVGMRPSISFADPKPSHGVKHRHRVYNVSIGEQDSKHAGGYKCDQDDKAMWRPVVSVEAVPFTGWVFNLEVEDDHSYVADGIGVHNCVYNALSHADQIVRNTQFGDEDHVPLSPISGYRWNAPGPSTGSNVGGAIKWHEASGLLPIDCDVNKGNPAIKITHPAVGYRKSFATGWQTQAKAFRADEWFRVSTVEGWVSAILSGFPCVGGRQSHAICHCGLAMDGGRILSIYANSWGSWGSTLEISTGPAKTFGFDSESLIRTMVSRDGWCLRTVLKPSWLKG